MNTLSPHFKKTAIFTQSYEIGRGTYFSPDLQLKTWLPSEKIIIGNFCSIADHVQISCGGGHRTDTVSTFPFDPVMCNETIHNRSYRTSVTTVIGHDVWIGSHAIITSGVTIGSGAVIGAGAVVFDNVAPYAIVAGNPAKTVRFRFSAATVKALLAIQWWHWENDFILENLDRFYKPITEFVEYFKEVK